MADADEERLDRAVQENVRGVFGGILVVLPVLLLTAVGAPRAASIGYLIVATVVLLAVVVRRRLRRSEHSP